MSGDDIYYNFQGGVGSEQLASSADVVHQLAKDFQETTVSIGELAAKMESAWQGDASGKATRGAGPMIVAHAMAIDPLDVAQDLSHRQAGSFNGAKYSVVPVPPLPSGPVPWPGVDDAGFAHYQQQVVAHHEANVNNLLVMKQYESDSTFNTDGMPMSFGSFDPDSADIVVDPKPGPPQPPQPGPTRPPVIRPPGPEGWHSGGDGPPSPIPDTQQQPVSTGPSDQGSQPQQTRPDGYLPPNPTGGRFPGFDGGFTPTSPGLGADGRTVNVGVNVQVPRGDGEGGGRSPGGRSGLGGDARAEGGGRGSAPRGSTAGPGSGGGPASERGGFGSRPGAGASARAAGGGGSMGGPAGSSRGAEDFEHARPEWLEGGDPEDLFGTDVVTAPPVIGAED